MSRKWWIIVGLICTLNGILLAILGFGDILYDESGVALFTAVLSVIAFVVAIALFLCAAEAKS